MPSQNEARETIYKTFKAGMEAAFSGLAITFEGENFDSESVPEYVKCSVRHLTGGQYTLGPEGSRVYRRRGYVVAQVFIAVNSGLLRLDSLSNTARDLFEGKVIEEVSFYDGNVREVGPDGKFHQGTVTILFDYDETK